MGSESDVAAWAKTHGAGFEVAPLIEQVRGRRAQIGFTVRLFARMPMDARPQKERWAEAVEIRKRLLQILQSLAPAPGAVAASRWSRPAPPPPSTPPAS